MVSQRKKREVLRALFTPRYIFLFFFVLISLFVLFSSWGPLLSPPLSETEQRDGLISISSDFFRYPNAYQEVHVTGMRSLRFDVSALSPHEHLRFTALARSSGLALSEDTDSASLSLRFNDESGRLHISPQDIVFVPDQQEYLVEFKEQPLVVRQQELIRTDAVAYEQEKQALLHSYRERLSGEHREVVLSSGARQRPLLGDPQIKQEYVTSFNGVLIANVDRRTLRTLEEHPSVQRVTPNRKVTAFLQESIPQISAERVWQEGYRGANVTIAIIDTGVDYTHPDLGGCYGNNVPLSPCKVSGGYDFVNDDADPMDDQGHGTHVAATAAGGRFMDAPSTPSVSPSLTRVINVGSSVMVLETNITDGFIRLPLLYANASGTFVGIGSPDDGLSTSPTSFVLFNESRDDYFVASHHSGTSSSSYVLSASVSTQGSILEVEIVNEVTRQTWCDRMIVGQTCTIGNASFIISSITRVDGRGTVGFTAGPDVSFNTLYTREGLEIALPYAVTSLATPLDVSPGALYFSDTPSLWPQGHNGDSFYLSITEASVTGLIGQGYRFNMTLSSTLEGAVEVSEILDNNPALMRYDEVSERLVGITPSGVTRLSRIRDSSLRRSALIEHPFTLSSPSFIGVAPDAHIIAYKVLDSSGSGSSSNIISAIERAVDPNGDGDSSDHLDILSMSLGGGGDPDDPMSIAVDNAVRAGVVAVIAAGNSGPRSQTIGSPGTARKAITVGAVDKKDTLAYFSSRGPVIWSGGVLHKPEVVAPGVSICAAQWENAFSGRECTDGAHAAISGTSMATPHVAGLAALLKGKYPALSAEQIRSLIISTADDLGYSLDLQGVGRINAVSALNASVTFDVSLIDFGKLPHGETSFSQNITLTNLGSSAIALSFVIQNASNGVQNISVVTSDTSVLTLAPGQNQTITLTLTDPLLYEGLFEGKLLFSTADRTYTVPYTFARLSELFVRFPGHYPTYYMVNDDLSFIASSSSSDDEATFTVPSGSYLVYALSGFVDPSNPRDYPETDEYMLIERVQVPFDNEITHTFSLSRARQVMLAGRSITGEELQLNQEVKAISLYQNQSHGCHLFSYVDQATCEQNPSGLLCDWYAPDLYCGNRALSHTYFGQGIGDRLVSVSTQPVTPLSVDYIFNYFGVTHEA